MAKLLVSKEVGYVAPYGPKNAKIAIVGEAPGKEEEASGKPFVGASGRLLDQLLRSVGINRYHCYITNVAKYRPPKNDFSARYYKRRNKPSEELLMLREELLRELEEVKPNLIICLGAEALRALTGDYRASIGDWRGSILNTSVGKAIATYHPAMVLRQFSWYPIVELDLKRAAEESKFPEVRLPKRELLVKPKLSEVRDFIRHCKTEPYISFDIETFQRPIKSINDPSLRLDSRFLKNVRGNLQSGVHKATYIDCIAIAPSADLAMCIPITYPSGEPYWSLEDERDVWLMLYDLLGDKKVKSIAQNAQYDTLILRRFGIRVTNLWMDTMLMSHTVYPEFPKGLDFLTSIFTKEPFYKDEIRSDRWPYNAKDAAVTYEVAFELLKDAKEFGVDQFYFDHIHPMIHIFMDMQEQGVLIDAEKLSQARAEIKAEIDEITAKIEEIVGRPLNPSSPKQMKDYLYGELKMPKRFNKSGNLTADEDTLRMFYKKTGRPELELLIKHRKLNKVLSTYLNAPMDIDGRMRTSYVLSGTETGRLASRSSVDGTGTNLQNVPEGIAREIFIPDPGYIFVAADASQAEARIVAYLSDDKNLQHVFESGGDVHKRNASMIFGKPEEEITDDERQLGKRISHAANYMMSYRKFAQITEMPEKRAKELLDSYFQAFPNLLLWHKEIEETVKRDRMLTTPFGRKRYFYGRLGPDLFRAAVAYIPQSTVADLLHRALRMVYARLPKEAKVKLQVHDSLVVQCLPEQEEVVRRILVEEIERPVMVNGYSVVIPADAKVGKNWNEV